MLLVNVAPTDEDHKLIKLARRILGHHTSCFSRIFLASTFLTPEEDEYPAGPTNMFFKPFLDADLHSQFRGSTHMFWMEHDVYPLRSGWLDALLTEAGRGDFWISGSVYLGDGLDNVAASPSNWNWVGHINGNALYNLKDEDFVEFMRLTIQYEPPNHFWKPFDVSMWRVLHAFPYCWPIYQRYRSKFVFSDFINHWGFHVTDKDVAESAARPAVFLIHGANFSAGNVLLRPKAAPADVVWDDRVLPSARLSILICATGDDLDAAHNSAVHAMAYAPGALEVVVVPPPADVARFKKRFSEDTRSAGIAIADRGKLPPQMQGEAGHRQWVWLHADAYCKGDLVLHLSSREVLNRLLELRDLLWLSKPMVIHRAYREDEAAWAAGAGLLLGAPEAAVRCFRTEHLHVYPRGLYRVLRERAEAAHGGARFKDVLAAAASNGTQASARDLLGNCALLYAGELASSVPVEAEARRALRLPPPVLRPPFFGA